MKYIPNYIVSFLFFLFSIGLSGQDRIPPLSKIDSENAALNYQKYCALCHGDDREGNAADYAPSLKSESLMSTIPLNFLASSIGFGRPDTPMAAYIQDLGGPLSMKEIFNMAIWLKHESGAKSVELSIDPINGDLQEGLSLYLEECATCHGKKGEGKTGPALSNPAFLAFATDHYIKFAINNGREMTKMKGYKDKLSEEDMNDLTAYIRSLASGWSAKPKELAPYPRPENYVINPTGENPKFDLINDRYAPMKQVMAAMEKKGKNDHSGHQNQLRMAQCPYSRSHSHPLLHIRKRS